MNLQCFENIENQRQLMYEYIVENMRLINDKIRNFKTMRKF